MKKIRQNIISVSGGKDSTAMLLLAIEGKTPNLRAVFADTGHEHPITYNYLEYLNEEVYPIETIRADFSNQIERKRQRLLAIARGKKDLWNEKAKLKWTPKRAAKAADLLQPTGVPFLDLVLARGQFPSTKTRFCSTELKRDPLFNQIHLPLLDAGYEVYSWQGVRRDESINRRDLEELEEMGGSMWHYRPILDWTAEDCFAMHKKHGVKHNYLYEQSMHRVGCMPCIHAGKKVLLAISKRWPEEVDRVRQWEKLVSKVSSTGAATFFPIKTHTKNIKTENANTEEHGIDRIIEWANTSWGGRQYDLDGSLDDEAFCSSIYGLCE